MLKILVDDQAPSRTPRLKMLDVLVKIRRKALYSVHATSASAISCVADRA